MSSDGLFRWVDNTGQIMAESISWADGNVETYDSGDLDASSSEGWLVLASPAGWLQMRPMIRNFVRHRKADRQSGFDRSGNRQMKTAMDAIAIPT